MNTLSLFLYLSFILTCTLVGAIKWPDMYYIEAEKIDLIQHSVVPYKLWSNSKDYQLRSEIYNDQIKYYLDLSMSDDAYMFHYKADKNGNPIEACSIVSDFSILAEPIPDIEDFQFAGKEIHEGKRIQVWTSAVVYDNAKWEKTMYVYRKKPVKYIYRQFDIKTGAIEDSYVINFLDYTRKVNADSFKFDNSSCEHIYNGDGGENLDKYLDNHDPEVPADVELAFIKYKTHHQKQYKKNEYEMRKTIFKKNWLLVNEHNKKNLSYKLTMNKFADRTPEEMRKINAIRPYTPAPGTHQFPHTEVELAEMVQTIPEEFDWRTLGVVSSIKSQGSCGSCWAFATTAAIEGHLGIKYGTNFDLSEQSIVDCAWAYRVYGCDGGYSERALKYAQEHGIPTEEEYGGYLAQDGKCHVNNMTRTYKIRGHVAVTPYSVNALKAAVYKYGPVATYVYVDLIMSMYSNGIFYEVMDHNWSPDMINHVVVVVGYGVRDGDLFWIVKNSYGQEWGEDGYILISAKDNTGNILFAPYYPLV